MNNFTADFFKVGEPLNACIIDASSPLLTTTATQNLASTIVYATDSNMQLGTIAYGEMIVANQNHTKYQEIKEKFVKTIDVLKNR